MGDERDDVMVDLMGVTRKSKSWLQYPKGQKHETFWWQNRKTVDGGGGVNELRIYIYTINVCT